MAINPQWQNVQGVQAGASAQALDRAGALFGTAIQSAQGMLDRKVAQESAGALENIASAGTIEDVDAARAAGAQNAWADQTKLGAAGIEQKDAIKQSAAKAEQTAYDRSQDSDKFALDVAEAERKAVKDQNDVALRKAELEQKWQLDQMKMANDRQIAASRAAMANARAAGKAANEQLNAQVDLFLGSTSNIAADAPFVTELSNNLTALAAGDGNSGGEPLSVQALDTQIENWKNDSTAEQLYNHTAAFARAQGLNGPEEVPPQAILRIREGVLKNLDGVAKIARENVYYDTTEGRAEAQAKISKFASTAAGETNMLFLSTGNNKEINKFLNYTRGRASTRETMQILNAIPEDATPTQMAPALVSAVQELNVHKFGRQYGPAVNAYITELNNATASGVSSLKEANTKIAKAEKTLQTGIYNQLLSESMKQYANVPNPRAYQTGASSQARARTAKILGIPEKDLQIDKDVVARPAFKDQIESDFDKLMRGGM